MVVASVFISLSMCITALAGTWTYTNQDSEENTRRNWHYIRDDNTNAQSEWILDNGIWYWIDDQGILPVFWTGIADDGRIYNKKGELIDFTDNRREYLSRESLSMLNTGITYEEVVNILGLEHENDYTFYNHEYKALYWYSEDLNKKLLIYFTDNVVTRYYYQERNDFK